MCTLGPIIKRFSHDHISITYTVCVLVLGLGEVVSVMLERRVDRESWRGAGSIAGMPATASDRTTYFHFNVLTNTPESVMTSFADSR